MTRFKRHAFTLLEVLVALGVFAMSVLGLMSALNASLSAAREARLEEDMLVQVQNRLALLQSEPLQPLQRAGTLDYPAATFTESIAPRRVIGPGHVVLSGFWTLSVEVDWNDRGTKQQEKASVIGYAP